MAILKAIDLKKSYRNKTVLHGISLTASSGEVVGILGKNGAGKTTTFDIIIGLIQPDSGHICLNDIDITKHPMHARAQLGIGYLPQQKSVFHKLSVKDNIKAILQVRKLSKQRIKQELEKLLEELHIEHLRDQMAMTLSGGEQRRVEVARALATEPHFIILDEPFAGVDPTTIIDIQETIKHLRDRDIGVLITDHNWRAILGICNRAYIVNDGTIMASGTKEEIESDQQVCEIYLGYQRDY